MMRTGARLAWVLAGALGLVATTADARCRVRDMRGEWDLNVATLGASPPTVMRCRLRVRAPDRDGRLAVRARGSRCEATDGRERDVAQGGFELVDRRACEWRGSMRVGGVVTQFRFSAFKQRDVIAGDTRSVVGGATAAFGTFHGIRVKRR